MSTIMNMKKKFVAPALYDEASLTSVTLQSAATIGSGVQNPPVNYHHHGGGGEHRLIREPYGHFVE